MARKSSLPLDRLEDAVSMTGMVEPVEVKHHNAVVSIISRQVTGAEKTWLAFLPLLLKDGESRNIHICRRYMLRDGGLVFGWYLSVDARPASVHWLIRALEGQVSIPAPQRSGPRAKKPAVRKQVKSGSKDFEDDAEIRRERVRAHTTAEPRAAIYDPNLHLPEPTRKMQLTTIYTGTARDSKNRVMPVVIQEMPLPHVNVEDMNAPNKHGRGANGIG